MQTSSSSVSSSLKATSPAHIEALQAKHEALEAKLKEEQARPHPDDFRIQELKKQKLAIKQELGL